MAITESGVSDTTNAGSERGDGIPVRVKQSGHPAVGKKDSRVSFK